MNSTRRGQGAALMVKLRGGPFVCRLVLVLSECGGPEVPLWLLVSDASARVSCGAWHVRRAGVFAVCRQSAIGVLRVCVTCGNECAAGVHVTRARGMRDVGGTCITVVPADTQKTTISFFTNKTTHTCDLFRELRAFVFAGIPIHTRSKKTKKR